MFADILAIGDSLLVEDYALGECIAAADDRQEISGMVFRAVVTPRIAAALRHTSRHLNPAPPHAKHRFASAHPVNRL